MAVAAAVSGVATAVSCVATTVLGVAAAVSAVAAAVSAVAAAVSHFPVFRGLRRIGAVATVTVAADCLRPAVAERILGIF